MLKGFYIFLGLTIYLNQESQQKNGPRGISISVFVFLAGKGEVIRIAQESAIILIKMTRERWHMHDWTWGFHKSRKLKQNGGAPALHFEYGKYLQSFQV